MREFIKKFDQQIILLLIFLGFGVLLLDAIFYAGFFSKHSFIDDKLLVFIIVALLVTLKIVYKSQLNSKIRQVNFLWCFTAFLFYPSGWHFRRIFISQQFSLWLYSS